MEYTIQKLSQMAGISTRTLRYYDEIGILKPARINSSGYRIYGKIEVDSLQQILFYRELEVSLDDIRSILSNPSFDCVKAMKNHRLKLIEKRERLNLLINNVEKTIAQSEGRTTMMDEEKFEGFKQNMIDANEEKYGREVREKYGDEVMEESNVRLKNMTQEQYEALEKKNNEFTKILDEAFRSGDPAGELAQKAADLHRQIISFYWNSYSKEAHAGLAHMYVDDERFTAYYDKNRPGTAAFLKEAILIYTGMN